MDIYNAPYVDIYNAPYVEELDNTGSRVDEPGDAPRQRPAPPPPARRRAGVKQLAGLRQAAGGLRRAAGGRRVAAVGGGAASSFDHLVI